MTDPVVKTIDVACDVAHAFDVFVSRIGAWWPKSHSASASAGGEAQDVTIEPRKGGAVFETMHDGGRDDWGEVLVYDPPSGFAMTWHPGNNKQNPTRVDVAFEAVAGGTRVTLTHSGWEAWADKADEMREMYNGGWVLVFTEAFGGACVTETA